MTRKDYTLIAHTIAALPNISPRAKSSIAHYFAAALVASCANFDASKFMAEISKSLHPGGAQ